MTKATKAPASITGLSRTQVAQAWLDARTKAARDGLLALVDERRANTQRKRWDNLAAAMRAHDELRVRYHATVGKEAKAEAIAAVRAADAKPEPKPAAKPARKAPKAPAKKAPAKAQKPEAEPLDADVRTMVAAMKAAGITPAKLAALLALT